MGTYKLSGSGKQKVEKAIGKKLKKWECENITNKEVNLKLSREATKQILQEKCQYYRNQGEWTSDHLLNFLIPEILIKGTKEKIEIKYPEFSTNKRLSFDRIEASIEDEDRTIQGTGLSPETCRRFRKGKEINTKPFKVFCKVLDVSCDEVREKNDVESNTEEYNLQQKLNAALIKLDHKKQQEFFKESINRTNKNSLVLYFKREQNIQYGIHWLIKSLIQETNNNVNHRIIQFNILSLSRKICKKNPLANLLAQQLLHELKSNEFKQLLKNLRTGQKLKKNSNLFEMGKILNNILDSYHIIFVFKDIDKIPQETINQILGQFYDVLYQRLEERRKNCFLICLIVNNENNFSSISTERDNLNHLRTINLEVPITISETDLTGWIQYDPDAKELFNSDLVQIIWKNSRQGNTQALLEAIYQECGCNLEKDDTWRKL